MFNSEDRPPIPMELRRRVLVEAGHRCAIPTCRYIEVDIHHVIPWATCKLHEYENLIALCPNCHRRADRGEIDRKALHIYKANLRFAHDKYSQFEIDVLFDLFSLPDNNGRPWPAYMNLLLKRIIDADFVIIAELGSGIQIGSIKTTPDILAITKKGREFINSLNISEL